MNFSLTWLSRDGKLLLTVRILRTFGYGFLSVVIAIYLKLLGFDDIQIGLLLGSALVSSVIFTLFASFYADRIGRRRLLIIYALLMSVSGLIFTFTDNYLMLILAAFIGLINAFLTIEQAILPQTIKDKKMMNTIYALYNMVGTFAMSAGILLSGLPSLLQYHYYGLSQVESIKILFSLYSMLGLFIMIIYFMISKDIEIKVNTKRTVKHTLSPRSKQIVAKLSTLFAIDSFAGGFVIQSVVSLWFFSRFGADLAVLSYIFSAANCLTALSYIAAAKIADRIGLVNTMVFTHIPSNILLILLAFAPSLPLAIILYLVRMTLSQMDVPTRQSYIVAIVSEDERTAALGLTNVSRNIAQTVSPSLFGYIFQSTLSFAAPFLLSGVIKIIYDLALYLNFRNIKPKDE
jgi:MFS family permease